MQTNVSYFDSYLEEDATEDACAFAFCKIGFIVVFVGYPDSVDTATAFLDALPSISLMFSAVTYPISIESARALAYELANSWLTAVTSTSRSSALYMRLSSKAPSSTMPASTGFMSSFVSRAAIFSGTASPFLTGMVSSVIQIVPWSIFVGIFASLNASIDVVVPPKNTGVAPGPMLTDFKEAKIPTKIDQGTIWITEETIPVKKGEAVPEKIAALLTKLDIKPVEAGIVLDGAFEDNLMYSAEDLLVDVTAVSQEFASSYAKALALSIEIGYVTAENIREILGKASRNAVAVSTESGYPTKTTIKPILQKANAQASSVASSSKYESK